MADLQAIQDRVRDAVESSAPDEFIYDLLRAYALPKASVTRLEKGDYNQARSDGEILWKNRLFFATADGEGLRTVLEEAVTRESIQKYEPRFVVATDFETIVGRDLKTDDTLDIPFGDLPRRYEFFLPWAGIEKARVLHENPADVKAAEKMAGLYDEILEKNPDSVVGSHDLNVFFARILFCLFAEDTGIFEKDAFSYALESYTEDRAGSVGEEFLAELFVILDSEERPEETPFYLRDFPYVNGGLFEERIEIPTFSRKARRILIESGSELDWSEINPDIFGSMMQAVAHEEERTGLGMHYTSVPNIMKVIGPLFLDELNSELEKARGSKKKLRRLWERLSRIKFFDPACGSGNFLIVTYKEIRKLEMNLIAALEALAGGQSELYLSRISLDQFYGIEIDDFAHEIAMLSLWLAEHQMNVEFKERFDRIQPYLPLKEAGNIACGNAALLDWETVCPSRSSDEVYLLGNPPYSGSRKRTKEQTGHMEPVLGDLSRWKTLDYIAIWFRKGRDYVVKHDARLAFVTTSSISQGDQVSILWPSLVPDECEICFAYQPFRWTNNARGQAGVTVAIIGLCRPDDREKTIITDGRRQPVKEISPYLVEGPADVVVTGTSSPPPDRPEMRFGNMPRCGGNLVLTDREREAVLKESPEAERYLRPYVGSAELIDRTHRWCLWIEDNEAEAAAEYPAIARQLEGVRQMRAASRADATRKLASIPHAFAQRNCVGDGSPLVVPLTSSERREYIPIDFVPENTIVSNLACAVYGAELWLFALLSSRMHMTWVRAVAGRLKTDPRYSSTICYNTFPFPEITDAQRAALGEAAKQVIVAREHHSEKTLADLYDPDEMPEDLHQAHTALDRAVDRCYRNKPFSSDEERLQVLFNMYEQMTRDDD